MAYIPTEWQTGDIITAEKLNKAEDGIAAAGAYIIPVVYDEKTSSYILQASFEEISAAASAGRLVIAKEETDENNYKLKFLYTVAFVEAAPLPYQVYFFNSDGTGAFLAATASDNLVLQTE